MSAQLLEAELQLPPAIREQITIEHRRTDGGYLIVQIPLGLVNLTDIAVDDKWVKELARKMEREKALVGGSGQIDPMQVGLPSGAPLFEALDGHHRGLANEERHAPYHLATVRANCTWENVFDAKLEHSERIGPLFTRANHWVGRSFAYSGLADKYTPEQAFAHYLGENREKWRDIDPEDLAKMHRWVDIKRVIWNKKPEKIYGYLLKGQGVTKKVIDMARGNQGGRVEGLTPTHVGNIGEVLADAPAEVQIAVAEHARDEKLSAFHTWELARRVQKASSVEAVHEILLNQGAEQPEISEYEMRERRIDDLTRKVVTGITKFVGDKTLTLMSTREQTASLLIGASGTAADQMRRESNSKTPDKYKPELNTNERPVFSRDLRTFQELMDQRKRHEFATELLVDALGFNLDPSTKHGLYPKTENGVDWIKMAHPTSTMIACCFGKNGDDQSFKIDGFHVIYSEGYKGVHALQTKTQSEKPRPTGNGSRRIVKVSYGDPQGEVDPSAISTNGHSHDPANLGGEKVKEQDYTPRNGIDKKDNDGSRKNGQDKALFDPTKSGKEGVTQIPKVAELFPFAPQLHHIGLDTKWKAISGGREVTYQQPTLEGDIVKVFIKDAQSGTTQVIGAEAFLNAFEPV
jgi:hypothetical protein